MLLTPAEIKPESFESRRNLFSFSFYPGWMRLHIYVLAWALRLLPQSYQYPNLSEGADRVGGQLRGDKECPFSGVTKSGRVWRKVPESNARSVRPILGTRGLSRALTVNRPTWPWPEFRLASLKHRTAHGHFRRCVKPLRSSTQLCLEKLTLVLLFHAWLTTVAKSFITRVAV